MRESLFGVVSAMMNHVVHGRLEIAIKLCNKILVILEEKHNETKNKA